MRMLLTGASGFIGAHVSAYFAEHGADVVGFCRSPPPADAHVADWIRGDVTDARAVNRAMAGCQGVIHAAALYSYDRSEAHRMSAVNVDGTRNVVQAAARRRIRVVMTSSSATCGPVPGRPATERDAPPPWELQVPYKATKLAGERLALAAAREGVDVLCVNPTTVVGPGDRGPTPSGKMVRDLVAGRMVGYIMGAGINVVAARDVARGHALAFEHGKAGERYILGGQDLWLRDAFAFTAKAVGRRRPWLPLPWSLVYGASVATNALLRPLGRQPTLLVLDEVRLARVPLFFSSARARAELGYNPGAAADALTNAARWFVAEDGPARNSAGSGRSWSLGIPGRPRLNRSRLRV